MDKGTIKNAIERSRKYNEVVRCEVVDELGIEAILQHIVGDDYGISPENRDEQGREVLDAYGDDWRIQITVSRAA
jgi:hypothetical protein